MLLKFAKQISFKGYIKQPRFNNLIFNNLIYNNLKCELKIN